MCGYLLHGVTVLYVSSGTNDACVQVCVSTQGICSVSAVKCVCECVCVCVQR